MLKEDLVIAMMGQDAKHFVRLNAIPLSRAGFKVIWLDGGSTDGTVELLKKEGKGVKVVIDKYEHSKKGANGIQRNKYLKILQEHFLGKWALVLDADEVVDPKELSMWWAKKDNKMPQLYDVHMEHFINSLQHVDNTVERHYVPRRLFRIDDKLFYPESEHCVLSWEEERKGSYVAEVGKMDSFTIYHFGYARGLMHLPDRVKEHLKKSEIHNQDFLQWWYRSHIFGTYPVRPFDVTKLPSIIKEHFLIPDIASEVYFEKRMGLEAKHYQDAIDWKDYFEKETCTEYLLLGCGAGQRVHTLKQIGESAIGVELDEWVVKNSPYNQDGSIKIGDITEPAFANEEFDVVVAYDVLEHLTHEQLDRALENIYNWSKKWLLVSVPTIGDPNLEADETHLIKEAMQWWQEKIEKAGFELEKVPEHWQFREQLILARKKQ